jgi:hypothetical protein
MHQSEAEQLAACSLCGAELSPQDRAYTFCVDRVLCFECATARHGIYDEQSDRWVVAPNVADLVDSGVEAAR